MVLVTPCLLRHLGKPELCEPTSSAYLALHGYSGAGGRIGSARIPKEYAGLLLQDLTELSTENAKVSSALDAYKKSFDKQFRDVQEKHLSDGQSRNQVRVKSVYLWSESPGTGKTTVACALLQEYLLANFLGNVKRGQTPPLAPVYFLDVNDWQTDYNGFNRKMVDEETAMAFSSRYYRAMEKAKHAELVVLDDIGVRASTDGFRGDLHAVINHRVTKGLPTIYTSNIPISELPDIFGEQRLADRIRDMTKEIHFEGDSLRGIRK